MTYTQIMAYLKDTAWALENTASLPHFAIAGALSMGTHGSSGVYQRGRDYPNGASPGMHGENAGPRSGVLDGTREDGRAKWGNLGTQCVGVTYVVADGSLVSYTEEENPEHFSGAVCSLGCLGAMASITLRLVPAFNVKQRLYRMVPLDGFIDGFREMVTSIDSFSAFVSWVSLPMLS